MRDEKEERKKQARSNKLTRQSNTAHVFFFVMSTVVIQLSSIPPSLPPSLLPVCQVLSSGSDTGPRGVEVSVLQPGIYMYMYMY